MKQRYPKVPLFLAFFTLIFYLPTHSYSQCLCSDGTAPQTLVYNTIGNISPSLDSTIFVFPKFDPAVGTLICVNAKAYVTSVIRMRLENDEIFDVFNYRIKYTRNDQVTGPGISPPITGTLTKNYGPYILAPSDGVYFSGPDYKVIGPDTVYKNKLFEATTNNVVPYLGPGTVAFTYKVSGATVVTGSSNYILSVSANDRIDFYMTYSYCNTGILSLNLKEFYASRAGKQNISLKWLTENETQHSNYEIEISQNAKQFQSIGSTPSKPVEGTATKYEYQYHLDQPVTGKLYFRIKQTDGGSIRYSNIRAVNMDRNTPGGFQIYPNPVLHKVFMEFDQPLNGDYVVELSNLMGQVFHRQSMKLNNSTILQINLTNPPAPGIYYIRAMEVTSKKSFTGKLMIQR